MLVYHFASGSCNKRGVALWHRKSDVNGAVQSVECWKADSRSLAAEGRQLVRTNFTPSGRAKNTTHAIRPFADNPRELVSIPLSYFILCALLNFKRCHEGNEETWKYEQWKDSTGLFSYHRLATATETVFGIFMFLKRFVWRCAAKCSQYYLCSWKRRGYLDFEGNHWLRNRTSKGSGKEGLNKGKVPPCIVWMFSFH